MSGCATGCGRPTERMLCEQCLWEYTQALDLDSPQKDRCIPALLDDLAITFTRRARMTQRNGKSRSAERPLIVHVRAADMAAHARSVLVGWMTVLKTTGEDYPANTLRSVTAWLLDRADRVAMHDAAADIHDEITDLAKRIKNVIDRPADKLYAGVCGTQYAEAAPPCTEPLYAHPGGTVVRCIDCGTVHEVTKRRDDMLRRLDDRLVTAAEFARLATYLVADIGRSREQTRKLVNQWHKRGLLERKNHVGDPLFRFADAIAVLARDQARRDERDQEKRAVPA